MSNYNYTNAKTFLLSESRTEKASTIGADEKFLSENLDVESIDGVKILGVRGVGDDVLVSNTVFVNEIKRLVLRPFLKTLIGSTKDNFSNKFKDSLAIVDDYFEYLLLDGRQLNTADYLDLAKYFGVETQPTFNLPNVLGRFEKNNVSGGEVLGTIKEDEIKTHNVTSGNIQPTTQEHSHGISGLFSGFENGGGLQIWGGAERERYTGSKTTSNSTVIINPFTVTSTYTGGAETQPKHILKQKYIIAKVNF